MALCKASGIASEIDLAAVPVYEGALELVQSGIRSTIWEANRDAAPVAGPDSARKVLLHDPQTSGGLLASVAAEDAEALVAGLRERGHAAAVIGRVVAGAPAITCV
jgi:selenide,water dikinase